MQYTYTLTFILMICISTFCTAQKIKVQKEQVLLDNKEVLKIHKVDRDKLNTWVVQTPSGDTAATFVENRIELKLLPHETQKRWYEYYQIRFYDSDTIGYMEHYTLGGANHIGDMLGAAGCFADGKYAGTCAKSFITKFSDWTDVKISDVVGANDWRDSLLKDEAYLKYSATLPKRAASLTLEIKPDSSIMVFEVKLGRYRTLVKGSYSTSFQVLNQKNHPMAIISYEYGRHRVFIRAIDTNAGKEYFIKHEFDQNDIYDAVAYLVDYGYL